MIESLDLTIKKLILQKGLFDLSDVEIRFDQPTRDWAAGLTKPAINCYLYDIRENRELRNREWIVDRQPNGQTRKKIAPLRVDVSYLVTAWTNEVEDEHAILWRVLVALASTPILPEELLKGELVHQPFPIPTQTAQVSEAMHNLSDLWNVMENELKPAINYAITLAVDREYAFSGPMVFTKRVDFRQRGVEMDPESILQIAGIVHEKENGANPVVGAEVWVVERGQRALSDRYGRYTFRNLPPGTYTFRVAALGRTIDHRLTVPEGVPELTMYDLAI
ncbi:MAG: DUF4255 domain-containing protein [Anaerolineae bacterium]|nr:DUF4255 domain-containing protein [Anaerolineae bacterium]